MMPFAHPHYEEPGYLSEGWYRQHRELVGGEMLAAAVENRRRTLRWHSAFIRLGDVHYRPALSEAA